MFCKVLLCLSVTFLNLVGHTRAHSIARYECGPHGKFEYCVDKIPGCVIGCHCHPGYYFDTETKICEPHTKLTDDYRRRFMGDANLIYPVNTPRLIQPYPTQTTTRNAMEERIDEISKDTDDIGDWLYSQFFKAVESQVIKNSSDETPMTRRSGNGKFKIDNESKAEHKKSNGGRKDNEWDSKHKIKRKTRKSLKGKGKKSKSKVHGLRRKLLRITEDDSLFDSESDDDSRGGSDTSSSGSSESSSSSNEGRDKGTDNRDHGHKKVIIFNRRPRPPLPSFIFLPSMDTPYYPPIGLPPPPIMPMYPMVPVPPMAPPLCATLDNNHDNSSTTTPSSIASSPNGDHSVASETVPTTTPESPAPAPPSDPTPPDGSLLRGDRRTKSKIHKIKRPNPISVEQRFMRSGGQDTSLPLTSKQSERIKLLQKLKETLEMHGNKKPDNDEVFENPDLVELPEYKPQQKHKEAEDTTKDVNFKYLSELIHRQKLDDTTSNNTIKPLQHLPPSRRNYGEVPIINYGNEITTSRNLDPDDAIYMNLGRQIASIIRDTNDKIHNNMGRKPAETNSLQESINSILNENSYAPQSYWERFVRSPLNRLKTYLRELHLYKQSNEKDLLTLENELQIFASTVPPLSLQDLENMLTAVQKTYTEMNKENKFAKQSNTSLNVNLLPTKLIKEEIATRRMSRPSGLNLTKHIQVGNTTTQYHHKEPIINEIHDLGPANNGESLMDDWVFTARKLTPINKYYQPSVGKPTKHNSLIFSKTSSKPVLVNNKISENSEKQYLKFVKKLPAPVPIINKSEPPSAFFDYLAQYPRSPTRYPILPTKDVELPAKKFEPAAAYSELSVKYPELPTKYSEQPAKYSELLAKYADVPSKYPERLVKFSEQSKKQPTLSAKYLEASTKYQEPSAKYQKISDIYREASLKNVKSSANYPEPLAKYQDPSAIDQEPSAKYTDPLTKYPEPLAKYQEPSAIYEEPSVKYPEPLAKYQDTPAKYPETPAKYPDQPEKYSNQYSYLKASIKIPEQSATSSKLPVKYPDLPAKYSEQFRKHSDLPGKYVEQTPNFPELPTKYADMLAKYPDQPAKYQELNENIPDTPEKFAEHSAKYSELLAKYPDLSVNLPELPEKQMEQSAKYFELPSKYPDLLGEFSELPGKTPEVPTKYSDIPSKYKEILENSPHIVVKHSDISVKYPEVPTKYTDTPENDFEQAVKYHHPLDKQGNLGKPAQAIINYKSLNYFSGTGNKRHYLFRATYPGYKKIGSNMEDQKPSYFHHEFHHFDYFE